TDRSTSAPIPNATATTCVNAPTVLPATVATPAARPNAIARLTTNSTLGPGIAISTNAVTVNASRCVVGSTTPAYEPAPEESHRVSVPPTPCLQQMTADVRPVRCRRPLLAGRVAGGFAQGIGLA